MPLSVTEGSASYLGEYPAQASKSVINRSLSLSLCIGKKVHCKNKIRLNYLNDSFMTSLFFSSVAFVTLMLLLNFQNADFKSRHKT